MGGSRYCQLKLHWTESMGRFQVLSLTESWQKQHTRSREMTYHWIRKGEERKERARVRDLRVSRQDRGWENANKRRAHTSHRYHLTNWSMGFLLYLFLSVVFQSFFTQIGWGVGANLSMVLNGIILFNASEFFYHNDNSPAFPPTYTHSKWMTPSQIRMICFSFQLYFSPICKSDPFNPTRSLIRKLG